MNIAWYTPFSIQSAIGRFSRLVVAALRNQGVNVQIVRSETKTAALRSSEANATDENYVWGADLHRRVEKNLRQYDLVIYNVGDHYDNHTYCFEHQPIVPGVTILHDYSLHNALLRLGLRTGTTDQYCNQLSAECGPAAAQLYERLLHSGASQLWWHHEISRFPVYRWALRDTLGVVTHAEFYRGLVAQRIGCPAVAIPLAYDTPVVPSDDSSRDPDDKLTIITVGSVNANKRYEAVIRALAESPRLRHNCRFRIVGAAEPAQRQMIDMSLESQEHRPDVTLVGQVSRAELERELASAQIISCLRYPVLEGASASVVEGLLTGKPVLACATGCYEEIPDELVFKVSPRHEHTQLTQVLEQIVADYPAALRRAESARRWAAERHSPQAYAKQLLEFAQQVHYDRPVLQVADRIANHFQIWESTADPCLLRQVDRVMFDLFGHKTPERRSA